MGKLFGYPEFDVNGEEILCTYDITMADGEIITVEIGAEYLVINDIGYKAKDYDTLRDWTLELLK